VAPPAFPGLDLAGACVPARNVGGDYYDFLVREEEGHLAAVIADVSGHNVASALMMAVVRSALRSEIRQSGDPAVILERLNSFLYEDLTRAELFLSLLCVVYEPGTGRLRFASAGHNPALLCRPADGGCRALDADGLLTGVLEEMSYPEEEETLQAGDVILLYTDGLVEAMDPSGLMFGMERLATALERSCRLPAGPLLNVLFDEVYAFSGERSQADDMTAVVLKVTDPGLR
jgi:serine phosphatase RsbU (regulator of sigma subunit)